MIWLFIGCFMGCLSQKQKQGQSSTIVIDTPEEVVLNKARSGSISDGVFVDASYPFQGLIPKGWRAEMGPHDGAMRLRLTHVKMGAVVEMWRFVDILDKPAPRSDCTWEFIDKGRYAIPKASESLLVATCMPSSGKGRIVFGILRARPQGTWQFEIHAPSTQMLQAKRAGEALLNGFEWVLADDRKPALPRID